MKRKIDLLSAFNAELMYKESEKSGNSTRLIDLAIQLLFDGYIVEVKDHNNGGTMRFSNEALFDRLLRRLFREHPAQMKDHVKYDKEKLTIEFI